MFELLPFKTDLESKKVLKQLMLAHRALAELKGVTETIPICLVPPRSGWD